MYFQLFMLILLYTRGNVSTITLDFTRTSTVQLPEIQYSSTASKITEYGYDQHHNMWFGIAQIRQFIFLCSISKFEISISIEIAINHSQRFMRFYVKMYPTYMWRHPGLAVKRLIEIWKSVYSNQIRLLSSSNKEKFHRICKIVQALQHIDIYVQTSKYSSPETGNVLNI